MLLADGQVLVAGGVDYYSNQLVNAEELYDPTTGNWARTSRLVTGRDSHTATLLRNGKVLVAGGLEGVLGVCNTSLRSAELYDPGDEIAERESQSERRKAMFNAVKARRRELSE